MKRTLKLRALRKEDAELTWRWRNLPEVREFFSGHPFYVNPEKEEKWYEKTLLSDSPNATFGVEVLESETLVGVTSLININFINRSAEIALFMGDNNEYRGRDYIRSLFLTLNFGFYELNLHRIYGKIVTTHKKLIKIYQKIGFREEGITKQSFFRNGVYKDELHFGLICEEYKSIS